LNPPSRATSALEILAELDRRFRRMTFPRRQRYGTIRMALRWNRNGAIATEPEAYPSPV
jgi:hypothetical protein